MKQYRGRWIRVCGHYFPDSRIGASLKLRSDRHVALDDGDFPDSRIGASLKRKRLKAGELQKDTSPIRESGPH